MFASTPALSALDHGVYDVRVLACTMARDPRRPARAENAAGRSIASASSTRNVLARHFDRAEAAQMLGHELAVEQAEAALDQPRHEMDQRHLRGVALAAEHALAEEGRAAPRRHRGRRPARRSRQHSTLWAWPRAKQLRSRASMIGSLIQLSGWPRRAARRRRRITPREIGVGADLEVRPARTVRARRRAGGSRRAAAPRAAGDRASRAWDRRGVSPIGKTPMR